MAEENLFQRLANELQAKSTQVSSAVKLLDEGATVPFIARYRKEVTGGLDDGQLRLLEQRLYYLRELEARRAQILRLISEQQALTPQLEHAIRQADNKTSLEDLYLPYKPKRRSKGQTAIEAGLQPLAERLLAEPHLDAEQEAQAFINEKFAIATAKDALEGAKFILMERFISQAPLLAELRQHLLDDAMVVSKLIKGQEDAGQKFKDYFDYSEALQRVPSHRALAILRGRNEGILSLSLALPDQQGSNSASAEALIAKHAGLKSAHGTTWLMQVCQSTWRQKLRSSLENELLTQLRERADDDAITVFSRNLHDLLMAAPAGAKTTMGLDPGLRTGVKVAIVDATGKLLATDTIYPHPPKQQWQQSLSRLNALIRQYKVNLISIGNGTGSRETDKLVSELLTDGQQEQVQKLMVSEAGASVYSASELAAKEFPQLDVSLRGAVSIARRLQDPLAELVKIDPKAIGVGQYQHDVNQTQLSAKLDAVVEDCVNAVGVDLNTASAALLSRVAGLSNTLASNIVDYRDQHGAFASRAQLKKVPRLGPKAFEQCAGFLRIRNGKNPLDASAVHPEAYSLVERIAKQHGSKLDALIGASKRLATLNPKDFVDAQFGLPTINDVLSELNKPGRDPRPEFVTAKFKEGVENLKDLKLGMQLEGVVTNVTNFGAFVDIGVHQDGLVHISALSHHFVKDPHQVVKAGQVVKVKVLEVDIARKRIALTMRLDDALTTNENPRHKAAPSKAKNTPVGNDKQSFSGAFADAFAKAKKPR